MITKSPLVIDGDQGEGGGQVLRTSLSLSVALGRPVRVEAIRAGRAKPGLMRQHLTCVRAAAAICGGTARGDALGSTAIAFKPGPLRPGRYEFKVGSAGSCLLVLQTVLPPLLRAEGESEIIVEGGTHNPAAPPWELIERAWLPALARMGARVSGRLERYGFMPAGGGRAVVTVSPGRPVAYEALDHGEIHTRLAEAIFANLPLDIAERELATARTRLSLREEEVRLRQVKAAGPGNAVVITLRHDQGAEVVADFGAKGRTAEAVASSAADDAAAFLASGAAVGRRLADQLMLPLALMAGGRYTTVPLSRHSRTNIDVLNAFAPGTAQESGQTIEIAPIFES